MDGYRSYSWKSMCVILLAIVCSLYALLMFITTMKPRNGRTHINEMTKIPTTTMEPEHGRTEMIEHLIYRASYGRSQDEDLNCSVEHNYSARVTPEMISTFQAALPPLLPNYRNPCWYEAVPDGFTHTTYHSRAKHMSYIHDVIKRRCDDASTTFHAQSCCRIRCFPHFFLIGVAKAATTDIHTLLSTFHPNIAPNSVKEPSFWRRYHHNMTQQEGTFSQYMDLFDYSAEIVRRQVDTSNEGNFHPVVIGDFSPSTHGSLRRWYEWPGNINQSEPKVTTAHLIYHIRPETKLVYILRDPVARAISSYYYGEPKHEDLHSYFSSKIEQFHECLSEHLLRYCIYTDLNELKKGIYYVFAKDWLDVFSSQQLLILGFEDYIDDRVQMLNKMSHFLDIGPIPSENIQNITEYKARNVNRKKPQVPSRTIDMLKNFYSPWQNKLEDLLKNDKRLWNKY